jgi:predicted amidophosphoribosyltransferase
MSHDRDSERDLEGGEEPARDEARAGGAFVWPPRAMVEVKGAGGGRRVGERGGGGGGAVGGTAGVRAGFTGDRREARAGGERRTRGDVNADQAARDTTRADRGRGKIAIDATGSTVWGFVAAAIEDAWLDTTRPALWRRLLSGRAVDGPRAAVCARCGRERAGMSAAAGEGGGVRWHGCEFCEQHAPAWSEFVRVGRYRGVLRDAIRELKFERGRATGVRLGKMLGRRIAQRVVRLDRVGWIKRVVMVPMPTTRWRRVTRGIDHARVITRAAAGEARRALRAMGHPAEVVMADLLTRRSSPSQTRVTGSERRRNVAGVFRARGVWWERARGAELGKRGDQGSGAGLGAAAGTAAAATADLKLARAAGVVGSTEKMGERAEDGQAGGSVGAWRRVLGRVGRAIMGGIRPLRRICSPWGWVVDIDGRPRRGVVIVGVDDISTTGATMHQAIRAIERAIGRKRASQAGVELWGASVAVTGASERDKDAAEAGLRGFQEGG